MSRLLPLLLCLLLGSLPLTASARMAGPEAWQSSDKVRDLAEIRRSGVLQVLVNQSRNSSGEIKGEAIGVEYARLRAFEQYLNRNAASGKAITLKIVPKAKDQLLGRCSAAKGIWLHPGSCFH